MKLTNLFFVFNALMLYALSSSAQSAVVIYNNPNTGKGDYMFRFGMPSKEEAENQAKDQIINLGYEKDFVEVYASTNSKGFGMILRSRYKSTNGLTITVYGASAGCNSIEEAEQKALETLKEKNQDWNANYYDIIQNFFDEPDE
ncbi:MAG: hypothetical protein KTR26_09210 [Flammeovirgaceae bacterium]|nr:hypothetical protein [Flammeovirgaceae bacterium]